MGCTGHTGNDDQVCFCSECTIASLTAELADARGLVKEVKKLRRMLSPGGDYAICSATEGEPVMRLVDSVIVGSVTEKIDKHLNAIDAGKNDAGTSVRPADLGE